MKHIFKTLVVVGLLAVFTISAVSCANEEVAVDLWATALYEDDVYFGDGAKTLMVSVTAEDKTVTFTLYSDEKTVGEALLKYDLIAGEKGPYGLYVKVANGITADYDVNKSYWAFMNNGEALMTGVDGEEFSDGDRYELVYTKG